MFSVPGLKELCLENIAENLIFHSKVFQETKDCEELQLLYTAFQYLFSDQLLERICTIHCCDYNQGNQETRRFADYLFSRNKWKGKDLQSCLNLVFNKFSKNIFVSCRFCITKRKAPWKVVTHIFSKCEDPREVDLNSSYLKQSDFLKALPKWHKVVKLDLTNTHSTNKMVCKIWESLPDLEELCLSDCPRISDKCLYYLCKSSWVGTKSPVCEENGSCTAMGKKLRHLDVSYTKVTDSGIICALLHLQALRILENGVVVEADASSVACGVLEASEICLKNDWPPLRLQLSEFTCTKLVTPEILIRVLPACPSLKKLRLFASPQILAALTQYPCSTIESVFLHFTSASILDSSAFQNFLLEVGSHLDELALNVTSGAVKTKHVVDMLKNCPNLTKFFIGKSSLIGESNYNDVYNIPESVKKLSVLDLLAEVVDREPIVTFFLQVIERAEDLKALNMSCCFMKHIGTRLRGKIRSKFVIDW